MTRLSGAILVVLVMDPIHGLVAPTNYRPPFNSTRTNFCSRAKQLRNGSVTLANFLAGTTVSIAVHSDVVPFYMTLSPNATVPTGGFVFALHNQLAARGGFKIKYVMTPGVATFASRTEYLQHVLPYVDLWGGGVSPASAPMHQVSDRA